MSKKEVNALNDSHDKSFDEIENGFFVKPTTFYKNSLDDEKELDNDIVVVENVEVQLEGRDTPVFQKEYYYVKDNQLKSSSKREVTDKLREQMKQYMLQNKHWPPFTQIKKKYKNGKVKVEYKADNWTVFNIKFNKTINDQDTAEFLDNLKKYGEYLGEPEELQWKVEHAKSSRAKCRSCNEKIEKDKVRIGKPATYQGRVFYKWYHPDCASREGYQLRPVIGLEELSAEELEELVFYELIDEDMI